MSTETSITDIAIECQTHGEWAHLLDRLESLSVPFYGGGNVSHYNAGDYVGFIIVPFKGVIADRIIRFDLDSNKVVPYRDFSANRDFLKQLEALAGEAKIKRDRINDEIMQVKAKLFEYTPHFAHTDFASAAKQSLSGYEESVAKMAGYYSKSNIIEERDDVLSEEKINELEALVKCNNSLGHSYMQAWGIDPYEEKTALQCFNELKAASKSGIDVNKSPAYVSRLEKLKEVIGERPNFKFTPSTVGDISAPVYRNPLLPPTETMKRMFAHDMTIEDYMDEFLPDNPKCREYPIHPNEAFTPYNEDEFKLKSKSKRKPSIIHIDDEEVKVIRVKRPVKRNIINIKTKL